MLIFLYGPDSYRRQKKLNKIVEEYRKKYSGLSCDFFDLENPEEFNELNEFSAQGLLFDAKKLAVLKNIFGTDAKSLKEFFKRYLTSEDFTILISENGAPPKEFDFLIKKAFLVEKFENLEGEKWRFFIQKEAKERKINLAQKAIDFLADAYAGDSWGLIAELEKISLLNSNSFVDVADLKKIGDYGYESPDIFGFINAVIKKHRASSIIALEKLFINQEEPVKIFNIFASLNRLSKDLIRELADYDIMVKSGKLDYEEVLLDLALAEK
jgi:DNA polymerase III delta subunit